MDRWVHIDDVQLWGRNANSGDVGAIILSIQQFGFNNSIVIWQNNELRSGNHSIMALRQLKASGWQPQGDGINDQWQVRYIDISHLSEIQADAFGVAMNQTTRIGHDDPLLIAQLLQDIANEDEALFRATAYDSDDLDELLRSFNAWDEWHDMPEFEQDDISAKYTIKVHINTDEDLKSFGELMQQNITDKTKYIYHPKQQKDNLLEFRVGHDET